MVSDLYVWQKKEWPSFKWDNQKLQPLLYETIRNEAYFLGKISALGMELGTASLAAALEDEIVSSSSIEDIMLDRASVRSSILHRLGYESEGLQNSDRCTEGAVSIVIDAVMHRNAPLTKERLFGWHAELFPEGFSEGRRIIAGRWRQGEMYIVSGRTGKEIIHYEAPPAESVDKEMDAFLSFINEEDEMNPVIKAAVAHFWFVSIHPFADGNGRIARTISEMLLARADGTDHRYYSLSAAIMKTRNEYYEVLEYCQKGNLDITGFIRYFLKTLSSAIAEAENNIQKSIAKTMFWDSLRLIPLNERETKLINRLIDGFEGRLTTEKWAKIAKCSHSTALRDINDLICKGILKEDGGGSRNKGYKLNYSAESKNSILREDNALDIRFH